MNKRAFLTILAVMICLSVLAISPAAFADGGGLDEKTKMGLVIGIVIVCASGTIMSLTSRHYRKKREANERRSSKKRKPASTSGRSSGGNPSKDKKRNKKKASQARSKNRK